MPLDLGSTVPDALDSGIAPQSLGRQLFHQAHATENLYRIVCSTPEGSDAKSLAMAASSAVIVPLIGSQFGDEYLRYKFEKGLGNSPELGVPRLQLVTIV